MAKRKNGTKPGQAGPKPAAAGSVAVDKAGRIDAAGNPISAEDRKRFAAAVEQIYNAAQKAFTDNGFDSHTLANLAIMRVGGLIIAQSLLPEAPRPECYYDFGAVFAKGIASLEALIRQQREAFNALIVGPARGSA